MATRKQNIVIVGGGAAAATVAQGLSKAIDPSKFNILLVTERPYLIHYPAMLRVVVTPTWTLGKQAFVPFDKVFKAGKAGEVVVGKVVSVEGTAVHLEDGRTLAYDYLVLATGTTWNGPLVFPTDVEKRDKWIAEWQAKFAKAKDVVIIGGGGVGVELGGELRHFYPTQRVTIVHDDAYILNDTYPETFRKYGTDRVRGVGINVILGDRATLPKEPYTSITTEKGKTIPADLIVPAWGANYNTAFLESFDKTILSERKQVRVRPTLQVKLASGKTNVYAVGDIVDWKQNTQLGKVPAMAGVVVTNILASIEGNKPTKEYEVSMEAIVLPLGPKLGFGYIPILWGITLGNWLTWLLKSRTLFVGMARGSMGY